MHEKDGETGVQKSQTSEVHAVANEFAGVFGYGHVGVVKKGGNAMDIERRLEFIRKTTDNGMTVSNEVAIHVGKDEVHAILGAMFQSDLETGGIDAKQEKNGFGRRRVGMKHLVIF